MICELSVCQTVRSAMPNTRVLTGSWTCVQAAKREVERVPSQTGETDSSRCHVGQLDGACQPQICREVSIAQSALSTRSTHGKVRAPVAPRSACEVCREQLSAGAARCNSSKGHTATSMCTLPLCSPYCTRALCTPPMRALHAPRVATRCLVGPVSEHASVSMNRTQAGDPDSDTHLDHLEQPADYGRRPTAHTAQCFASVQGLAVRTWTSTMAVWREGDDGQVSVRGEGRLEEGRSDMGQRTSPSLTCLDIGCSVVRARTLRHCGGVVACRDVWDKHAGSQMSGG